MLTGTSNTLALHLREGYENTEKYPERKHLTVSGLKLWPPQSFWLLPNPATCPQTNALWSFCCWLDRDKLGCSNFKRITAPKVQICRQIKRTIAIKKQITYRCDPASTNTPDHFGRETSPLEQKAGTGRWCSEHNKIFSAMNLVAFLNISQLPFSLITALIILKL